MEPMKWDAYYERQDWPWDVGGATPALVAWVKANSVKGKKVLVPGCGRGHDAIFLAKAGAKVTAVDYSELALIEARKMYPESKVAWIQADVTQMTYEAVFDLVWEYTCFCALLPELRLAYQARVQAALKSGGTYFGFVFERVSDPEGGPPFQVEPEAFKALLKPLEVLTFEPGTERSIKTRYPNEIWFQAKKA